MNPHPATNEVAGRETPPRRVWGRRLFVARRAWVALAALTMGLFFASVPVAYARLATVCEGGGCDFLQLSPAGAKALEGLGLSVGIYAAYNVALAIILALGYWASGLILFWKRSDDRLVFYASIALVTFGAMQPDTLRWLAEAYPVLDLPVDLVYFVGEVSFFILFCVFPDGRFVPRWTRWAAAAWIFYQLLNSFFPDAPFSPGNWPLLLDISLFMGMIGSLVVAQIYRYRRVSGRTARQQTKWVVFGFTVAIVVGFVGVVLIGWIFDLTRSGSPELFYKSVGALVSALCALLVPVSIGIAIRRYRLWDIDFIINRTLVYGILSAVLAGVFAITDTLLLPLLVQSILGEEDSSVTPVVSAVVIAVLFKPLRSRIEAGVKGLTDRHAGGDRPSESPR